MDVCGANFSSAEHLLLSYCHAWPVIRVLFLTHNLAYSALPSEIAGGNNSFLYAKISKEFGEENTALLTRQLVPVPSPGVINLPCAQHLGCLMTASISGKEAGGAISKTRHQACFRDHVCAVRRAVSGPLLGQSNGGLVCLRSFVIGPNGLQAMVQPLHRLLLPDMPATSATEASCAGKGSCRRRSSFAP